MGTRSTTLFIEKDKDDSGKVKLKKICKFYRQMDGYPEGHGMDLATFLADGELVNGYGINVEKKLFNGMGCLAAQVIDELKDGVGRIYMIPVSEGGQEYNYTITGLSPWYPDKTEAPITIRVSNDSGRKIFEGTPDEFIKKFGEK